MDINEIDIKGYMEEIEKLADVEEFVCPKENVHCYDCVDIKKCIMGIKNMVGDVAGAIILLYKRVEQVSEGMHKLYESLNLFKNENTPNEEIKKEIQRYYT